MQERKRSIEDWLAGGGSNVAGLCRTYQISRKTGYKWMERFRQGGLSALEDRSHAARRQPGRMPGIVERRIVAAWQEHPSWGPKKLRAWPDSEHNSHLTRKALREHTDRPRNPRCVVSRTQFGRKSRNFQERHQLPVLFGCSPLTPRSDRQD